MPLNVRDLVSHRNPEGVTLPIYRDHDLRGNLNDVRTVYVTTVDPGTSKGPIVHSLRSSIVTILSGRIALRYRAPGEDEILAVGISADRPQAVDVPPGYAVQYDNSSGLVTAMLLVTADLAWRANDNESVKYNSWSEQISR